MVAAAAILAQSVLGTGCGSPTGEDAEILAARRERAGERLWGETTTAPGRATSVEFLGRLHFPEKGVHAEMVCRRRRCAASSR